LREKCLTKHFTKETIVGREGKGRCKQLLDDRKKQRLFWKLKYEAPDRTLWATRFGRVYGPKYRNTDNKMNARVS